MSRYGRFLLEHDDLVEPEAAEPVLQSYLAHVRAEDPENVGLIAAIENAIGGCLSRAGHHAEAEPRLVDTLPAIQAEYGAAGAETIRALQRIIEHYEGLGEVEKVAEYRHMLPVATEQ